MTQAKTPWNVVRGWEPDWEGDWWLNDADGNMVCMGEDYLKDAVKIEFLVKAVNGHDANQRLIKRLADTLENVITYWYTDNSHNMGKVERLIETARGENYLDENNNSPAKGERK